MFSRDWYIFLKVPQLSLTAAEAAEGAAHNEEWCPGQKMRVSLPSTRVLVSSRRILVNNNDVVLLLIVFLFIWLLFLLLETFLQCVRYWMSSVFVQNVGCCTLSTSLPAGFCRLHVKRVCGVGFFVAGFRRIDYVVHLYTDVRTFVLIAILFLASLVKSIIIIFS